MKLANHHLMFYIRILLLATMLTFNFTFAQTTEGEKLNKLVTQFEEDLLFSYDKASKTAEILINEAKNQNTIKANGLVNSVKALQLLKIANQPDSAKVIAKKAYTLHKELKDSLALFRDIHTIYECYVTKKQYDSAVYYAASKLELANKLKKPSYKVTANLAMADVYYWTRQHDKVITYRKEALQIAEKNQLKRQLADIHIKLARAHHISSRQRTKKTLDSAIYHGKKSLDYAKQANYTYGIYTSSIILADFLNVSKKTKEALALIKTVINSPKDETPLNLWYDAPFYYAVILKDNGNYKEAKAITKKIIYNLKPDDYRNKKSTYFFLSALYSYTKQPDSADYALKQAIIANNAHSESKMNNKIAKLQTEYETNKKEQQIQQLEQQRRLEQLEIKDLQRQRIILAFIPITLLIIGGWFLNRRRLKLQLENEQKERAKQLSELKALRAQMNPHFMFNALASIQDFILLDETDEAAEYLGTFAQLMRGYLEASKSETITLAKEIELLKLYIELEGLRIGEGFNSNLEVDSDVNIESLEIPPLLIQPYVENSFKHGLIHKKGIKNLEVLFKLMSINNEPMLEITIRDNGIGRKKSAQINAKKYKLHTSFATEATEKRLALLNNYNKKISVATKDLHTKKGNPSGTEVTLKIAL